MMRRWIQLERAVDHGRRSGPLPQRDQRFGRVSGQHRAQRALQTKLTGHLDAAQRLARRIVVPPDVVQSIGVVDIEAQSVCALLRAR